MIPTGVQVQPIDSLTPFLSGQWWIKARVTDKGDIRTWNKQTSSGKLVSFTLIDESGSIRATIFNDYVDMWNPQLVNGKVYYFSGGQVKAANRRFSNVNCDYEITFDKGAVMSLANDQAAAAIPMMRYNFVPISLLKSREVGSAVDVLAVVTAVGDTSTIVTKARGESLVKRTLKIADRTAMIEMTLWGTQAQDWRYPVGSIIAFRNVKLGSFDGLTLSTLQSSVLDLNPPIPDTAKLSAWFASTNAADVPSLSNQGTLGGAGNDAEGFRGRKFFEDIAAEGLGRSDKPDYVEVRCTPVYLKQDNMWYDACPVCQKKVQPSGANSAFYRCEKCDKDVTPVQRYLASVQASDNVSQMWLTLFNEAGQQFFGMTAPELKARIEADKSVLTQIVQSRMYRPLVMRCRVKEDRMPDQEERVRLTVVKVVDFIPPPQGTDEDRKACNDRLKVECQSLLDEIKAYTA